MVSAALIVAIITAVIAVALGAAYQTGALNPLIEKVTMYIFKAEAKAEEKKLQAQGMKEGEDFFKGQLGGNQKADEASQGLGKVNEFTKNL